MKKIECQISEEKMNQVDTLCQRNGYTYAEFNRRAIDVFLNRQTAFLSENHTYFFKCPDCSADLALVKEDGHPPKLNFLKHNI